MIYIVTDSGHKVVILDPSNLADLMEGGGQKTPDGQIYICYTPDITWTSDQLRQVAASGTLNSEDFDRIISDSLKREPVFIPSGRLVNILERKR